MSFNIPSKYGEFNFNNGQLVAADIVGLKVNPTETPMFILEMSVYRFVSPTTYTTAFFTNAVYRYDSQINAWAAIPPTLFSTVITILPSGQFQYTSTATGSTVNRFRWRIRPL